MPGQTLTVLFTDVVGSTTLATRLGPDGAELFRRAHTADLSSAVGSAGGEVVKGLGDGIMAAFVSARSAVDAAVAMQQAVAARNRRTGESVGLRVGVAVGEVTRDGDDLHGATVVVASRLCDVAEAGQIVAADLVGLLVGSGAGHRFASIGSIALKGFEEPVTPCEVEWSPRVGGPLPFPARLSLGATGAFVGRGAERDAVAEALASSTRTVVAIAGEPGIGKTRLAAEVAREAHEGGAAVLLARCDDGAPELAPVGAMLGTLADALGPDAIRALAGNLTFALGGIVPSVAGTTAAGDTRLMFDAIDVVLSSLAAEQLVLVVLDDLQWADAATLQILRHLLRSSRPGRLQILATYRDTELGRAHPLSAFLGDLRRDRLLVRVHVGGLDREAVRSLIAATAGHDAGAEFVAAVHGETAGNPFFVGEVLTHLAETGAVSRDDDGVWRSTGALEDLRIPEGVREVVGRRLARLSSTANQVLLVAAVVGAEFDLTVAGRAAQTTDDELGRSLEEAVAAGLVIELGPGRATFRHALIRQTLLDELSATRRVQIHWHISDAMEARGTDPEYVAQHALAGALAGDAFTAISRAAAGAMALTQRASFASARSTAEAARALMAEHNIDDAALRYDIEMALAEAALDDGGGEAARPHLDAVADLARQLEDPDRLVDAALVYGRWPRFTADPSLFSLFDDALAACGAVRDDRQLARILGLRATHCQTLGDIEGATVDADALAALAESTSDPEAREAGLRIPALLQPLAAPIALVEQPVWPGWFAGREGIGARLTLRHALVGPARRGDRIRFEEAATAYAASSYGTTAMHMVWAIEAGESVMTGRFEDAKATIAGVRDQALEPLRGSVNFRMVIEEMFRAVRVEEGRSDILITRLPAFLDGFPGFSHLRPCLASQLAAVGRTSEALEQVSAWRGENHDRLPRSVLFGGTVRHLAEAAALTGDTETCEWLNEAIGSYAGELLTYGWGFNFEGSVDRARGQCAMTAGAVGDAIQLFESALELEEGFGAPVLAARTKWWLAKALLERGHRARGLEILGECARFTHQVGMRLLNEQARQLAAT